MAVLECEVTWLSKENRCLQILGHLILIPATFGVSVLWLVHSTLSELISITSVPVSFEVAEGSIQKVLQLPSSFGNFLPYNKKNLKILQKWLGSSKNNPLRLGIL